ARRNREWPLAAQQLRKAAPGAEILETRSPEELAGVAKAVKADRPRVIAIAGGDGTVTHTVTALASALGNDLPPLALLGGGAYDSLAPLGGKGGAEDRLRRLSEALASGTELQVEQPDAFQVLGLTAGPRQFALELPRLLLGLPARRDRLLEGVGEKLELSARAPLPWLLDGEIYSSRSGRLSVGLGPRVSLVRT